MNNAMKWILLALGFVLVALFVATLSDSRQAPERAREAPSEEPAPRGNPEEPTQESPPDSSEKQEYVNDVAPLIMRAADVMEKVGESLNDFADEKIDGPEASSGLKEQSEELSDIQSEIEELKPPAELEQFQEHLLRGLNLYEQGTGKAAEGIDRDDPALLQEAADLFEDGTEEINKANDEFDENTKDLDINKSKEKLFDIKI